MVMYNKNKEGELLNEKYAQLCLYCWVGIMKIKIFFIVLTLLLIFPNAAISQEKKRFTKKVGRHD